MRPRTFAFALASLVALVPACSSSSSVTPPGKDAAADTGHSKKPDATATHDATPDGTTGAKDVHPDVIIDPQNCVSPSATSSEDGIGGYCSPGGGQCLHAGTGGTATLCTADIGGVPAHEWFCTLPCDNTTQCGPGGGTCVVAPLGELCAPAACVSGLGDAGSPDIIDAGSDGGASDAADGGDAKSDQDAASDANDAAPLDAARDADGG